MGCPPVNPRKYMKRPKSGCKASTYLKNGCRPNLDINKREDSKKVDKGMWLKKRKEERDRFKLGSKCENSKQTSHANFKLKFTCGHLDNLDVDLGIFQHDSLWHQTDLSEWVNWSQALDISLITLACQIYALHSDQKRVNHGRSWIQQAQMGVYITYQELVAKL